MSNSSLVNYTRISPNSSNPRNAKIDKITIHHMAGNLSVETCGNVFARSSAGASSNYGVGSDGRIGMYVEEKNRSWCSSSSANDNRAITIEVANDGGAPSWHVSDTAVEATINLCVDICKRNGISGLNYTGDTSGNLTRHNMFVATTCPGAYLQSKFPYIASEVNKRLSGGSTSTPKPSTGNTYNVVRGDTLSGIGAKLGVDWKSIASLNGIGSPYTIYVNQKLQIPGGTTSTPSKSISQIADEVIALKWGNDPERTRRLTNAGYNAEAVQAEVNRKLGYGGSSSSASTSTAIKKGDRVRVRNGAKSYTGGGLASFVYNTTYNVMEISGNRAVIGLNGQVTTAISTSDIYKV